MEDLKQMWQQYDQKLHQTQFFNERMLRRINTQQTRGRIGRMMHTEIAGMAIMAICLLWLLVRGKRLEAASGLITGCYWLVILILLAALAWSLWKTIFISRLDSGRLPVTEMLHRMTRLRLMIVRERLWGGVVALVFLVVPLLIVMTFMMTGIDQARTDRSTLLVQTAVVLLVAIPSGLWVYRRYYIDSIDEIMENLREIKQFEDTPLP